MSYLYTIATANPENRHNQADFVEFYSRATDDEMARRKIKLVAHKSGIAQRFSVLKDFSLPPASFEFFGKNACFSPMPQLSARMAIYQPESLALSLAAVRNITNFEAIKPQITHIITVTCTGLFAPGLDIELIEALALSPETARSSLNFLGCNAAVLALKQADYICRATPNALVLIVCTELCTLHFQADFSDDYILSNLLFADGAAAALVGSAPPSAALGYPAALQLEAFRSRVVREGKNDMAWRLSEDGFIMNLTAYVSPLLNQYMPALLDAMHIADSETTHWAIHPGGKRILDDFCKNMNLPNKKLENSYQTLSDFGNMSSPTILFVLKRLMDSQKMQPNDTVAMAAFGPGLNIEMGVLRYVAPE